MKLHLNVPESVTAADLAKAMSLLGIKRLVSRPDLSVEGFPADQERHGNGNVFHIQRHRYQRATTPESAA